ncbi:MAG: hypothetical protein HY275_13105 [Gemmatimonadetes bacterium]|nr:hypothetical protein [Gemmatimonadota bacterium]
MSTPVSSARTSTCAVLLAAAALGCSRGNAAEAHARAAPGTSGAAHVTSERTLPVGTAVRATLDRGLTARIDACAGLCHAKVATDITDAIGTIIIPAGADVVLEIDRSHPASDPAARSERLWLVVQSVAMHNATYHLEATLAPIAHRALPPHHAHPDRPHDVAEDVIVAAGTPITFTLTQPLQVAKR